MVIKSIIPVCPSRSVFSDTSQVLKVGQPAFRLQNPGIKKERNPSLVLVSRMRERLHESTTTTKVYAREGGAELFGVGESRELTPSL